MAATVFHSSDEPFFANRIMEKVKKSKVAHWANKLAVESEPGLTTAQLMLYNHDLKPVCSDRRFENVLFSNMPRLNLSADNGAHGILSVFGLVRQSCLMR